MRVKRYAQWCRSWFLPASWLLASAGWLNVDHVPVVWGQRPIVYSRWLGMENHSSAHLVVRKEHRLAPVFVMACSFGDLVIRQWRVDHSCDGSWLGPEETVNSGAVLDGPSQVTDPCPESGGGLACKQRLPPVARVSTLSACHHAQRVTRATRLQMISPLRRCLGMYTLLIEGSFEVRVLTKSGSAITWFKQCRQVSIVIGLLSMNPVRSLSVSNRNQICRWTC